MSSSFAGTGGNERSKRVFVAGTTIRGLISSMADAEGIELVNGAEGEVDLLVVEVERPHDLPKDLKPAAKKTLVISRRRLRDQDARDLKERGADVVLDLEACLLDVAFAFSELLFATYVEHRRYQKLRGGTPVRFRLSDSEEETSAHLLGIARSGGFIRSSERPAEGSALEIMFSLAERDVCIRGRVAFVGEDGFAVEYAMEDHEVAPKLSAFCSPTMRAASILAV